MIYRFDAILQDGHIEINEKPQSTSRKAYVSQNDSFVDGAKQGVSFNRHPDDFVCDVIVGHGMNRGI